MRFAGPALQGVVHAAYWGGLAYATSKDGLHWEKPALDVKPGTNLVLDQPRGTTTVWLDHE